MVISRWVLHKGLACANRRRYYGATRNRGRTSKNESFIVLAQGTGQQTGTGRENPETRDSPCGFKEAFKA